GGLVLLGRGLLDWRRGARVAAIAPSQVESVAAGEATLVGTVEPGPVTLVSPLQSRPCVYYRARVRERHGDDERTILAEERGVGFLLRDPTGTIPVLPRGARWDCPVSWQDETGWAGDEPPGLAPNAGPAIAPAVVDREQAIADLLTVRPTSAGLPADDGGTLFGLGSVSIGLALGDRRRTYEERRIEPGATVTVIGAVLPFADVPDPVTADRWNPAAALDDPEVAASIAAARAAGTLAGSPEEAWGNAAIPGFGIGRPTRPPELEIGATPAALAPKSEEAAAARLAFDLDPGALVVGPAEGTSLIVAMGTPASIEAAHTAGFVIGIGGAVLAVASAAVLALLVDGRLG
ncbi:MAG: hypothetical protein H6Q36_1258, partial [Chloroflexi bacterium]|nr:hypothetical protein [Chloroflexota bacterium]